MRKHIQHFWACALFFGAAFSYGHNLKAQETTTPELTAALIENGQKINLAVSTGIEDTTCRIHFYIASKRKQLKRQSSKFLLIDIANKSGEFDFQIPEVKKIKRGKSKRNTKRIFFRYAVTCPDSSTTFSQFSSVLVRRSKRRKALSARKWFSTIKSETTSRAFVLEEAFPALSFRLPVDLKYVADGIGRFFVVEKRGTIQVFDNSPLSTEATTFLDIQDQVKATHEEGLLGLAFHPDFATNGFFYVFYTQETNGASIVSRFKVKDDNPNEADPTSEIKIMDLYQPSPVHQAGCMHFGSDGYLYISFGDGGGANDPNEYGQDFSNIYGTLVRIDVDATDEGNYGIPSDNPFVGVSGADERIYAYGFRNPWRFSFDAETDEIWLGDVGQGTYEEIDIVTAGENYGWDTMEGMHCFEESPDCDQTGLTLPIFEYDHNIGFSITGGYVYRGTAIESLIGKYIYADYTVGKIWALERGEDEVNNELLFDTELYFSSFATDADNELYLLDYGGGRVLKFTPAD